MEAPRTYRAVVLGAGAAGMMCAAHAGPGTLVVDHARAPGEKIRISGGGRCNFTNLGCTPERFLSANPHFCKSALSRYTQWDFIELVDRHGIAWHEKTLGQLFCDGRATAIVTMLRDEMAAAGAELRLSTEVIGVDHADGLFGVTLEREGRRERVEAPALVLATGGLSIPKMGATGLAYRIARQFGLGVGETRPGLVPLTFTGAVLEGLAALSGVAAPARVTTNGAGFDEALLFTHRGLSGPAVLQASSYWHEGAEITVDLDPEGRLLPALRAARASAGRRAPATILSEHLPQRLIAARAGEVAARVGDCADAALEALVARFRDWRLTPAGTEGYRTAEVTLGGIDTDGLSSKTMEARACPGLYAIGEAVDVTGWLGGYNFQWAWSSGWAAGTAIAARAA
ncbi:aminoacetone oxidase family FAD-binding enzyme [Palleronia sediminis]|uniref:Aminoacetone oxidase family FAD-binding enzyme n=1 Tax=Palleronia sediminis TaxID=2547833 RepID=A0A4R6AFA1_9RHOB|nr:aminoacetone oxidase family FAD-binding enzyme [Palleronia sediminis]TDL81977.1 aminoacetone oxidase family FAD-binding enzyme [Palleronia sediminis]